MRSINARHRFWTVDGPLGNDLFNWRVRSSGQLTHFPRSVALCKAHQAAGAKRILLSRLRHVLYKISYICWIFRFTCGTQSSKIALG